MSFYKNSFEPIVQEEIFGIASHPRDAQVILLPMPWEVTLPGDIGCALAPENILKASYQVKLFDAEYPKEKEQNIAMLPIPYDLKMMGEELHKRAQRYLEALEAGITRSILKYKTPENIDFKTFKVNAQIKQKVLKYLSNDKIVGIIGGEHSSALGLMEAVTTLYPSFGILQFDSEPNLQKSYQGFKYSHTSIMHNALQFKEVTKLVQVGLRDYCREEIDTIKSEQNRIVPFSDRTIKQKLFAGISWKAICEAIIAQLPEHIYISFDIKGLDPKLCPNSSRPIPGGLEMEQAVYLIQQVVAAGKKIISFDLCEIGSNESSDWDAFVGSQLLYHLSICAMTSQGTPA